MFKLVFFALIAYILCVSATSKRGLTNLTITAEIDIRKEVKSLRCSPTGGDHPQKEEACRQLGRANRDLKGLQETDCPFVGLPVTVTIEGKLRNQPVFLRESFLGYCDAIRRFGVVVKDVLPSFYE
ncbi:hypothetical protein EDC96DRAFT_299883 [Choanephora cucurbitarum]|nr:hypothetical protein EDC96DRAFT_299883 [Choanephora cucurbitarum]